MVELSEIRPQLVDRCSQYRPLYYTTQYSINQLEETFQFNMLIIGCLQLVSCLITNFYCQRMYRKRWIIIFMILSGGIGLLVEFTVKSSTFQIILIAISRLFNTFAFALFSLITTESFPTSIRSTGTGISEAMSNLGNMAAPFLVTVSGQLGVKAVLIGGFICIIGGASMFFVKQTKVKKVEKSEPLLDGSQKQQVAEQFGINDSLKRTAQAAQHIEAKTHDEIQQN